MNPTSGLWHAASTGNHQAIIVSEAGVNVAVVYDKKNAPLLAVAPEMLELLVEARAALPCTCDPNLSFCDCLVARLSDVLYRAKEEN